MVVCVVRLFIVHCYVIGMYYINVSLTLVHYNYFGGRCKGTCADKLIREEPPPLLPYANWQDLETQESASCQLSSVYSKTFVLPRSRHEPCLL